MAAPLLPLLASIRRRMQCGDPSLPRHHDIVVEHRGRSTKRRGHWGGAEPYSIAELIDSGVADSTTKTYLLSTEDAIYRLPEDASGAAAAYRLPSSIKPPPVSIITGDTCVGQLSVAPGSTPYAYAVHSKQNSCATDAVYVYANTAAGNAKPVRILSGPATKLDQPYGIYDGQ